MANAIAWHFKSSSHHEGGGEVLYAPKFTYIWTLAVGRFPDALRQRVKRETAVRELARCFLSGAGMTIPGEWPPRD